MVERRRGSPGLGNGPGLSKARGDGIGRERAGALVKAQDEGWRSLLERADVISEGASRLESGGAFWYGTTSIVVALPDGTAAAERERLCALAFGDPHLRVRVLRIAHREASARAPAALGPLTCELSAATDPRGLRIVVEVQAPLIGLRAPGTLPGGRTTPP